MLEMEALANINDNNLQIPLPVNGTVLTPGETLEFNPIIFVGSPLDGDSSNWLQILGTFVGEPLDSALDKPEDVWCSGTVYFECSMWLSLATWWD